MRINRIKGQIASGLGEGAFFLSIAHYKREIKDKLHFDPYPGTLNIKPINFDKGLLKNHRSISIEGFEKDGKKFGGATCYRAEISGINGAIIVPQINKHKDIIEFISEKKIRNELSLNDGEPVEVILK